MSVVLAVKEGNKIWMAADSQASRGGSKLTLVSPNSMKVWGIEAHPGVVMGGTGSLRDLNIISTMDSLYDPILDKANEDIDFKFVVREIVPAIMNELTTFGRNTQADNGLVMNSTYLLAKDGYCYSIDFDGCVTELIYDGEAMATGSGADVAMAAYHALEDIAEISIKEKLIRAVAQSCTDDLYVNYPIIIRNTEDDDVEVFDGVELYSLNSLLKEVELEKEEEVEDEDLD